MYFKFGSRIIELAALATMAVSNGHVANQSICTVD